MTPAEKRAADPGPPDRDNYATLREWLEATESYWQAVVRREAGVIGGERMVHNAMIRCTAYCSVISALRPSDDGS